MISKHTLLFCCSISFGGCSQPKQITRTLPPAQTQSPQSSVSRDVDQTPDFIAVGNTPVNWHMEMTFSDTVRFAADDGLSLKFGYNQLKKSGVAEKTTYTGSLTSGNVNIAIETGDCTVTTIRKVFRKLVTFTFNGKTYTGCGNFLADESLNNKWQLESIGGSFINPQDYNKIPVFQFDLAKQTVSGNDGCNAFGSDIEVQGSRIQFRNIISTKMACGKSTIEKILTAKISGQLVDYYFKSGKLYFYLPDDSVLVFIKADL